MKKQNITLQNLNEASHVFQYTKRGKKAGRLLEGRAFTTIKERQCLEQE